MTKRERKYHERKKLWQHVTIGTKITNVCGPVFFPRDSDAYDKYGFPKPFEIPNSVPVGESIFCNMELAIHKPNP